MGWIEVRKAMKEIRSKSAEFESKIREAVTLVTEIQALAKKAYLEAPKTDSMFNDSFLGPAKILSAAKLQMAKCGWLWCSPYVEDIPKAPSFAARMKEAEAWVLKFETGHISSGAARAPSSRGVQELL